MFILKVVGTTINNIKAVTHLSVTNSISNVAFSYKFFAFCFKRHQYRGCCNHYLVFPNASFIRRGNVLDYLKTWLFNYNGTFLSLCLKFYSNGSVQIKFE